ncbi:MAG TPA: TIGR01777 family oxidoreductase, partial [Chitinophagales bacterium]|nr:TIGR01777 family oxidoreductase [Chitinophagales bacterium]
MAKVIITGGTGLVGRRLTTLLENSGWQVSILCRKPAKPNEYAWDINRQTMDEKVLEGATAIIHLAGAGIADERWTDRRKQEIVDSRVQSAQLINSYLQKYPHTISHFISASAVGYYGDRGEEWLTENSLPGTGFVAEVCTAWEAAADALQSATVKVSKVRIGIVLSKDGGALPKLALPVKMGIGATMGNGKQYMPW